MATKDKSTAKAADTKVDAPKDEKANAQSADQTKVFDVQKTIKALTARVEALEEVNQVRLDRAERMKK